MKARIQLILLLLLIIISCYAELYHDGSLEINKIKFNLIPEVNYRTSTSLLQTYSFNEEVHSYQDSCSLDFSNPVLNISIRIIPETSFHSDALKVFVTINYIQSVLIRDIVLNFNYIDGEDVVFLNGPKAINSGKILDNEDLYPFTDKYQEIKKGNNSFWIVCSGFSGCEGVEWINNSKIFYYDHTLHFARLNNQTDIFSKLIDIKPCQAGQQDNFSFLIFKEKPYLLDYNLWPGNKIAALAITNDADGETASKLEAAFFGSSNSESPDFMTKGLAANNIKVSNTVFGINLNTLGETWNSIQQTGSSIAYHTYSTTADSTQATEQSLLTDMSDYNIRLWIDHSVPNNPEDFAMYGGITGSPYYILDIINQSNVDYAWLGDTPYSNPFNLFSDPWRLPHKLYYFQGLNKPVWFFGRTRMEIWEYINDYYSIDFKHNMTMSNLDRLVSEKGLCICYTHFSQDANNGRVSFFEIQENGDYVIRDDFNDVLLMLNDYQTNRGLWIDTVEKIFDRMLAVEQVNIVEVDAQNAPGFARLTLRNNSDYDIDNFSFKHDSNEYNIPLFISNSEQTILVTDNVSTSNEVPALAYLVYFADGNLYIRSKDNSVIPAIGVKIYNIKGQMVSESKSTREQNFQIIPFPRKSSGIYIAKITAEGFKTYITRFTVFQ